MGAGEMVEPPSTFRIFVTSFTCYVAGATVAAAFFFVVLDKHNIPALIVMVSTYFFGMAAVYLFWRYRAEKIGRTRW